MRLRQWTPILFVALGLAACGEEQTAQSDNQPKPDNQAQNQPARQNLDRQTPGDRTPPSSEAMSRDAPSSRVTPPPATQAQGAGSSTATQTVMPSANETPTRGDPQTTGAIGAGGNATVQMLNAFQNKDYSAGPIQLRLNSDNSFVMRESNGDRRVEGRYAVENGMLVFSEPRGDTGGAQFPMRCRFEPGVNASAYGGEFRLTGADGSCQPFQNLTFKPQSG